MSWQSIIGNIAPIAGGLIGGPAGAAIGSAISNILGIDKNSNIDDIAMAIKNATPEQILKLKEYDYQLQLKIEENNKLLIEAQTEQSNNVSKLNESDSNSGDKFRTRWRPFIGWVCCFILLTDAFNKLILFWFFKWSPQFDIQDTLSIVGLLLGNAWLRSYDKTKGNS